MPPAAAATEVTGMDADTLTVIAWPGANIAPFEGEVMDSWPRELPTSANDASITADTRFISLDILKQRAVGLRIECFHDFFDIATVPGQGTFWAELNAKQGHAEG